MQRDMILGSGEGQAVWTGREALTGGIGDDLGDGQEVRQDVGQGKWFKQLLSA